MSVFGTIVTKHDVAAAAEATVKLWLPTYLAEMERLTDRDAGVLPEIRSYSKSNTFKRFAEEQLPACIIVSPGTSGHPENEGDGRISAWWRIGIAVVISARDRELSDELAALYGAAIRTLFLQHPSLGGFANGLSLIGEDYGDVPADYLAVGSSCQVECDVKVAEISNRLAGPGEPADPLTEPPGEWPVADDVDITVTRRSPV